MISEIQDVFNDDNAAALSGHPLSGTFPVAEAAAVPQKAWGWIDKVKLSGVDTFFPVKRGKQAITFSALQKGSIGVSCAFPSVFPMLSSSVSW